MYTLYISLETPVHFKYTANKSTSHHTHFFASTEFLDQILGKTVENKYIPMDIKGFKKQGYMISSF